MRPKASWAIVSVCLVLGCSSRPAPLGGSCSVTCGSVTTKTPRQVPLVATLRDSVGEPLAGESVIWLHTNSANVAANDEIMTKSDAAGRAKFVLPWPGDEQVVIEGRIRAANGQELSCGRVAVGGKLDALMAGPCVAVPETARRGHP